jgi:hypothetical protein
MDIDVPAINPDWKGVIPRRGLSLLESHGRNNLLPSLDGGFIPRVLGPLSGSLHLEVKRNARGCRQVDDTSRHAVLLLRKWCRHTAGAASLKTYG